MARLKLFLRDGRDFSLITLTLYEGSVHFCHEEFWDSHKERPWETVSPEEIERIEFIHAEKSPPDKTV